MKNLQIRKTKDGSDTLWVPEMKESFHSLNGAITESQHVFLNNGLHYFCQLFKAKEVSILEIGFGTGLNALLTCCYGQENQQNIAYTSLEPFPLQNALIEQLNYSQQILNPQAHGWYARLHSSLWNQIEQINTYFSILKIDKKIQDHTKLNEYDICFFDGFAPGKQPEIWEIKVLDIVRKSLKASGILVTYCAQGQFKRDLSTLGFQVERLPGPPGKMEMTRATIG